MASTQLLFRAGFVPTLRVPHTRLRRFLLNAVPKRGHQLRMITTVIRYQIENWQLLYVKTGQYRNPAVLTAVETPSGPCHIVSMADRPTPPYELVIRPCTIDAGRYRWDIRRDGTPVQSSMESFASEHEAQMNGRREVKRLTLVSRLGR